MDSEAVGHVFYSSTSACWCEGETKLQTRNQMIHVNVNMNVGLADSRLCPGMSGGCTQHTFIQENKVNPQHFPGPRRRRVKGCEQEPHTPV